MLSEFYGVMSADFSACESWLKMTHMAKTKKIKIAWSAL